MGKEEGKYQAKRIKQLEDEGFYVIKLTVTNKHGITDLIAVKPSPDVIFSESKTPKGKLSPLQQYRHRELERKGFNVETFDNEKRE